MEDSLRDATTQMAKAIKEKEFSDNSLSSVEYEFDVAKTKFKAREKILVETLDEARSGNKIKDEVEKITALEGVLKKVEAVS